MPAKLERCVRQLISEGKEESSAYAICVASTGLSPHEKKSMSPYHDITDVDMHEGRVGKSEDSEDSEPAEDLEKSLNQGMVINPSHGALQAPVSLDTHIAASHSDESRMLWDILTTEACKIENPYQVHSFTLIPLVPGDLTYTVEMVKIEESIYDVVISTSNGLIIQEIKAQTLPIIASMICAKTGISEFVQESEPMLEEVIEAPIEEPSKSINISINGNEISILINKSEELDMSGDLVNKAFPIKKKPEQEAEKKPEPGKSPIPEKSQEKPEMAEKAPSDKPLFGSEQPETQDQQNPEMSQEELEKPLLQAAEESADNGNEVGVKDGQDADTDVDGETNPLDADAEMVDDDGKPIAGEENEGENVVFLKTTKYEGGNQYWYKDLNTGKVFEKDCAPEGQEGQNNVVLLKLSDKLQALDAKMDQILAAESQEQPMGAPVPGEEAPLDGNLPMEEENMEGDMTEEDINNEVDGVEAELAAEGQIDPNQVAAIDEGTAAEANSPDMEAPIVGANPAADQSEVAPEPAAGSALEAPAPEAAPAPVAKPAAKKAPPFMKKSEEVSQIQGMLEKVKKSLLESNPDMSIEDLKKSLIKASEIIKSRIAPVAPKIYSAADSEAKEVELKKSDKKIKKSRLNRMWTVFGIEMPETLSSQDSVKKAQDGIARLQKCLTKQGKEESEANKIINRAVIEKYDLLGKGMKNFSNYREWTSGVNVQEIKTASSIENFQEIIKSDSNTRFAVKEHIEASFEDSITKQKDGVSLAKSVKKSIEGDKADWSDYNNFEEKIEKSKPNQFEKSLKDYSDRVWGSKSFDEEKVKKSQEITKEVKTNLSEVVESLNKTEKMEFSTVIKSFDEKAMKKKMLPKTEQELKNEEMEKAMWGEEKNPGDISE